MSDKIVEASLPVINAAFRVAFDNCERPLNAIAAWITLSRALEEHALRRVEELKEDPVFARSIAKELMGMKASEDI